MRAVIFFSGLAGFLLFGPPFMKSRSDHAEITLTVREASRDHLAPSHQSRCRFEGERTFTSSVRGIRDFMVQAGSGSLEVLGVEGLGEIQVTARACASHEEFLQDLQISGDVSGSTVQIETHYPDWSGWSMGNRYARLDLLVEVPAGMPGEISDGSGEMALRNLGSLTVRDGSGEIVVAGILGDLDLQDGSGALALRDVSGNVGIQDGSGEIALEQVEGDLDLQDSSGEIEIRGVGGSVFLRDSSGEIDVTGVRGSVHVIQDSSGDIEVQSVEGDFVVERDGSGSIRYSDVNGRVDIPPENRRR